MDCLEFRRSVGAQPALDTPLIRAHLSTCAGCARYRDELQQMDRLIYRTLRLEPAPEERTAVSATRLARYWAAAASLLTAVGLGSFLWIASPKSSLAEQVVAHVQAEEGAHAATHSRVAAAELTSIMAAAGVKLSPEALNVSYAMSCWFRGRHTPHLVVQTSHGPLTVLVLTHETPISKPQRFEEEGFSGVIMPSPQGVLAVLGREPPREIAMREVLKAFDYEP